MTLNARRQELIKLLESSHATMPLTMAKLAHILGVSERTIRYDLTIIDHELKREGVVLHKQTNKGVWLEAGKRDGEAVSRLAKPRPDTAYDYVLSKEERCHAIIVAMLSSLEPVASDELAEKLFVSRSTLAGDLEIVRRMLQTAQLTLCTKRGRGIWVDGSEEKIRSLLVAIFSAGTHNFLSADTDHEACGYEGSLLYEYAAGLPVQEIAALFIDIVKNNQLPYNDFSINHMVISLIVQLKRLYLGRTIQQLGGKSLEEQSPALVNTISEQVAARLQCYHPDFEQPLEVASITLQLLRSKFSLPLELEDSEKNEINHLALRTAEIFVQNCQTWLGDIYVDDEELLYGLALHLQPAIQRARYDIKLTNPMLPQIREKHPELFAITAKAIKEIEQTLHIELSEDEMGYLTIHLGAAIERKKIRSSKKLKVLLVCGNGIGTVQLLSITLKNRMPYLDIVKVVSAYEWRQGDAAGMDLVISTVPLKVGETAILYVSPILSAAEIQVIENQIQYFYNKKFATCHKGGQSGHITALEDVLLAETIELDIEVEHWEDAIRQAGRLLVNTQAVEPRYVDAMVECVKRIGPYIVIAPGVAFPHSRPEDGVNQLGFSMIRLAQPIVFGSDKHDPVDLVFALGAIDYESHFRILSELWQLLNNEADMQFLRSCRDKEEVMALARRYSAMGIHA